MTHVFQRNVFFRIAVFSVSLGLLAFFLAWVSSGFAGVRGWGSFVGVLALGAAILWGGVRSLRAESPPGWVARLTLAAGLLRLGAGVVWFVGLPVWGHGTEVQQAGYIMADAFWRDSAAWELAQSGQPLTRAFTGYRAADQYGGLLFLSAAVYRYLGGEAHIPLIMVALAAAVSALAVGFTWAFTRRWFGEQVGRWAAWGMALYPEAVLLGSSQMREAFVMTLVAAVFYGLARDWKVRGQGGLGFVLVGLGAVLALSPPLTLILLALLGIVGLGMDDWRVLRRWKLWAALAGAALAAGVSIWLGWERIAAMVSAEQFENPWEMVAFWVEVTARWQAQLSQQASGVLQSVFRRTPEWFHLPFLLGYGVARPLLPAELFYVTTPMWWAIGVWRSLGWTALLGLLVYAPVRAVRSGEQRNLLIGLSLAVWLTIWIATYWGGGDQWDNPRYRAAFSCLQIALGMWAAAAYRQAPDAWLRRAVAGVAIILAWYVPWYVDRYTHLDVILGVRAPGVLETLGLGVLTWGVYLAWDVWRARR